MREIEKPKGVLFDMDGVITTLDNNLLAWKIVFKKKTGIGMKDEDWYVLEGKSPPQIAEEILKKYKHKISSQLVTDIATLKQYFFNKITSKKNVKLYPLVVEILTFLKESNIKLGLVTGSILERVKGSLPEEVFALFDVFVTADEEMKKKPFPDPYLNAAALLGFDTTVCWVIENAPLGIKSAKSAKCYCIGLLTTLKDQKKLSDAGADKIFKTHNELFAYFKSIFS